MCDVTFECIIDQVYYEICRWYSLILGYLVLDRIAYSNTWRVNCNRQKAQKTNREICSKYVQFWNDTKFRSVAVHSTEQNKLTNKQIKTKAKKRSSDGVYAPCIYSHTRWELSQCCVCATAFGHKLHPYICWSPPPPSPPPSPSTLHLHPPPTPKKRKRKKSHNNKNPDSYK